MSYLIFNEKGKKTGDIEMAEQCTSAIFNYQVIGNGAEVEFSEAIFHMQIRKTILTGCLFLH